jgi:hypothetical protein
MGRKWYYPARSRTNGYSTEIIFRDFELDQTEGGKVYGFARRV